MLIKSPRLRDVPTTMNAAGTRHWERNSGRAGRIQCRPSRRGSTRVSVLSETEIDHVRRFGEVRRFTAGELLFHAGETVPGLYVVLSGRVAIDARGCAGAGRASRRFRADGIGAPVEEMTEVGPGRGHCGDRSLRGGRT